MQTDLVMVATDTIILTVIIFSEGVAKQTYKMLNPICISALKGEETELQRLNGLSHTRTKIRRFIEKSQN